MSSFLSQSPVELAEIKVKMQVKMETCEQIQDMFCLKYFSLWCENCCWFWFCFVSTVSKQKEEGKLQGQLSRADSSQCIRELKDQIAELTHEVSDRCRSSHISTSFLSWWNTYYWPFQPGRCLWIYDMVMSSLEECLFKQRFLCSNIKDLP